MVTTLVKAIKEQQAMKDIHTLDFWGWVATVIGGLVGFVVVVLLG
jgi:hypothetical protein